MADHLAHTPSSTITRPTVAQQRPLRGTDDLGLPADSSIVTRLLSDLDATQRARLIVLVETHASIAHRDRGDASLTNRDAIWSSASYVVGQWPTWLYPDGTGRLDLTDLVAVYLGSHLDVLDLDESERSDRQQARENEAQHLEATALAAALAGRLDVAVAHLDELLALNPDRRLSGRRDLATTRAQLHVQAQKATNPPALDSTPR